MFALKRQYFLAFAVLGSLMSYVPLYLTQRGLSKTEIGDFFFYTGAAMLLTPVLVTFLADAHVAHRRLLSAVYLLSGVLLWWFYQADSFVTLTVSYFIYSLAFVPVVSLHDGLNFTYQKQRADAGLPTVDYHRIRLLGSFGFMLPAVVIFFLINGGGSAATALIAGIGFSAFGLINSFFLPNTRAVLPATDVAAPAARRKLPTVEAAKAMMRPRLLTFCIAMWFFHMSAAVYYIFYPGYVVSVGIDEKWIALIACIGVAVESVFILGFGWFRKKLGFRGILILGLGTMVIRLALLAAFPHPVTAIATQLFHGFLVLVLHLAPPVYLNMHADEEYRSSIQGLYAMIVFGTGRMIGSVTAGRIGEFGDAAMFWWGGGLCAVALILVSLGPIGDRLPDEEATAKLAEDPAP